MVAWTVFWFVEDDVLDADTSRSRGFEGFSTFRVVADACLQLVDSRMDPGSHGVQGCPSPGMAERGVTGLLKVGTMMTIGGMTNGWRAVMVNGEFRRLGGMMVLDGIATGMDIPGNRNQSKVRN